MSQTRTREDGSWINWTRGGALSGGANSFAYGINNASQVVGWFGNFASERGFLFEHGSFYDLNTLIDPASGWVIAEANAINDLGQIAGTACRDGQCYAVRLDLAPVDVPEPGMWMLMATGLAMLGYMGPGRRTRLA